MCLGELAEVVEVTGPGSAVVRSAAGAGPTERLRVASLLTLDSPVARGDWVLFHSGFALARLTADEARDATAIRTTSSKEQS